MSKPFLSDRNQAREGRTRDFSTAVMSERTVCDEENVLSALSNMVASHHM